MINNNMIRILMVVIQGIVGHFVDMYEPAIVNTIGIIGYNMIFIVVIANVMMALGFFKKENC